MRLKDKVAIVTGAARGIGEAMILRFVEEAMFSGCRRYFAKGVC